MNACDGKVLNHSRPHLDEIGPSGIALDVNGGRELLPDLRGKRRGKPFAKVKLLVQEDESPIPGYEAYP